MNKYLGKLIFGFEFYFFFTFGKAFKTYYTPPPPFLILRENLFVVVGVTEDLESFVGVLEQLLPQFFGGGVQYLRSL